MIGTSLSNAAATAARAVDREALTRDLVDLVRIPSITGREEDIAAEMVGRLEGLGLAVEVFHPDPAIFREDPDWPGEETQRASLPVVIGRLGRPGGRASSCRATWTSSRLAIPPPGRRSVGRRDPRRRACSAAARAT